MVYIVNQLYFNKNQFYEKKSRLQTLPFTFNENHFPNTQLSECLNYF